MKQYLAVFTSGLVLVTGIAALWLGTDGWQIWTAESARRQAIVSEKTVLPDLVIRDANNQRRSLTDSPHSIVLMDFIYTQCPTVCLTMGAEFRLLQNELVARELDDRVGLLSMTFDQERDGPTQLSQYLSRFGANAQQWSAARFEHESDLNAVLQQLGVVVIPEPSVGYVHNAAIYLIKDDRVVGIYDIGDRESVLDAVEWQVRSS